MSGSKSVLLAICTLAVFVLAFWFSCANRTPSVVPGSPAASNNWKAAADAPSASSRVSWEVEWDMALKNSRKEARGFLFAGPGMATLRNAVIENMKSKFGIEMDLVIAPSTSLVSRILAERRAGIYTGDVFVMGAEDLVGVLFPNQAADPMDGMLILPEVKNPALWLNGQIPFLDKEHRAISFQAEISSRMAYNTSLLKPEEVASFKDLLNLALKEKIVMLDPTISGSGSSWFYLAWKEMGVDYLNALVKNQPVLIRDNRQLVEWVSRGKYAVAIGVSTPLVNNFVESGAPIALVPPLKEAREIRGGVSYSGVLSKAPHPNAAKVFINWILSKEGQTTFSKITGVASRRVDVPTDFLDKDAVLNPKVTYVSRESEQDFLEKKNAQQIAKEIFAPLLDR